MNPILDPAFNGVDLLALIAAGAALATLYVKRWI
ncbi:hypothetical protein IW252_002623 [Zhihengliuella flava]|uniref:Uncharacterized protein n=1 Tax=Zhihengliuella flava TaxID=1285193 RepID=A0A931DE86_9MICC|nr:hypothetical protein [Zhihengliuella flava]